MSFRILYVVLIVLLIIPATMLDNKVKEQFQYMKEAKNSLRMYNECSTVASHDACVVFMDEALDWLKK